MIGQFAFRPFIRWVLRRHGACRTCKKRATTGTKCELCRGMDMPRNPSVMTACQVLVAQRALASLHGVMIAQNARMRWGGVLLQSAVGAASRRQQVLSS